jgi:hypothetical protein
MTTSKSQNMNVVFLNRGQLVKLRLKAMRSGVWFRALPRIDRALVDLTIKVACEIRSCTLAKSLLTVVRKVEGLMENKLLRVVREIGLPVAQKLSLIAQKWGNAAAKNWVSDGFAKFLAVLALNEPVLFKGWSHSV